MIASSFRDDATRRSRDAQLRIASRAARIASHARNDGGGARAMIEPNHSAEVFMTAAATFSLTAPADAARAAELRRVKLLATLVLAATLALFATAKALAQRASGCSASSRPLPKPPPSAAWPTGTPWSRCFDGRSGCRSRTPRSSRATSIASRTRSANSSRCIFWRQARRSEAAPDRFRCLRRRLAARPQAQRRSRALYAAAAAGGIRRQPKTPG